MVRALPIREFVEFETTKEEFWWLRCVDNFWILQRAFEAKRFIWVDRGSKAGATGWQLRRRLSTRCTRPKAPKGSLLQPENPLHTPCTVFVPCFSISPSSPRNFSRGCKTGSRT